MYPVPRQDSVWLSSKPIWEMGPGHLRAHWVYSWPRYNQSLKDTCFFVYLLMSVIVASDLSMGTLKLAVSLFLCSDSQVEAEGTLKGPTQLKIKHI